MTRNALAFLLAAALLLPGCSKTPQKPVAPPPPPPEEEAAADDDQAASDDGSDLSKFVKAHHKARKHKRTKHQDPPSRKEGLLALEEGKQLIDEAEFRAAEHELRIAAAAGIDGADEILLRVRTELSAEDLITSAQKKIAAKDFGGAKADLQRIPDGLILSELARQMLERIENRETEARKELVDRATKRFQDEPDGGEAAAPDPPKPDQPKADPDQPKPAPGP